jgi:hypothetical protein
VRGPPVSPAVGASEFRRWDQRQIVAQPGVCAGGQQLSPALPEHVVVDGHDPTGECTGPAHGTDDYRGAVPGHVAATGDSLDRRHIGSPAHPKNEYKETR